MRFISPIIERNTQNAGAMTSVKRMFQNIMLLISMSLCHRCAGSVEKVKVYGIAGTDSRGQIGIAITRRCVEINGPRLVIS